MTTYKEVIEIGKGAYGTVFKAKTNSQPSKYVAIKKFDYPSDGNAVPAYITHEIAIVKTLKKFRHPNIIEIFDVIEPSEEESMLEISIVFELMEMDLNQYIHFSRSEPFTPERVKDIMFQLLCGVDFLHTIGIGHFDLKPHNLLLSKNLQIKLADFGLSRDLNMTKVIDEVVVTLWYRAPEVLLKDKYNIAVDMWSIGCIFAECSAKMPLLPGKDEQDQFERILDLLGTPSNDDWPNPESKPYLKFYPRPATDMKFLFPDLDEIGLYLLKQMLMFNPCKRITTQDALNHPYFENRLVPQIDIELSK